MKKIISVLAAILLVLTMSTGVLAAPAADETTRPLLNMRQTRANPSRCSVRKTKRATPSIRTVPKERTRAV